MYGAVYRNPDHFVDYNSRSKPDCDQPESETKCPFKPSDEHDHYLELVPGHGWIKRSCARGTAFSIDTCGCSVLLETDDSSSSSEEICEKPETVACRKRPAPSSESYFQLVDGHGWILQNCAQGTAFNEDDCSCSITVHHENWDTDTDSHSDSGSYGASDNGDNSLSYGVLDKGDNSLSYRASNNGDNSLSYSVLDNGDNSLSYRASDNDKGLSYRASDNGDNSLSYRPSDKGDNNLSYRALDTSGSLGYSNSDGHNNNNGGSYSDGGSDSQSNSYAGAFGTRQNNGYVVFARIKPDMKQKAGGGDSSNYISEEGDDELITILEDMLAKAVEKRYRK